MQLDNSCHGHQSRLSGSVSEIAFGAASPGMSVKSPSGPAFRESLEKRVKNDDN